AVVAHMACRPLAAPDLGSQRGVWPGAPPAVLGRLGAGAEDAVPPALISRALQWLSVVMRSRIVPVVPALARSLLACAFIAGALVLPCVAEAAPAADAA